MKRITAVCIRGSDKREAEFDSVSIVVDLPAQQMCPSQQRKMNVEKKGKGNNMLFVQMLLRLYSQQNDGRSFLKRLEGNELC